MQFTPTSVCPFNSELQLFLDCFTDYVEIALNNLDNLEIQKHQ